MTRRRRVLFSMPVMVALVVVEPPARPPSPSPATGPAVPTRTAAAQSCEELRREGADVAGGPSAEAAAREDGQGLPEGVTPATVQQGRRIYLGRGYCYTCHGDDGKGIPGVGSDLTDREWSQTTGTLESLVDRIRCGVPAERSPTGLPMPPRGGGRLTADDLRAVAAYVWTLSRSDGA